jgi:D-glycero-D-manno-heptose 1,7-bisphosphate phosphatase
MHRAVFLDRDGTVNEEVGYVNHLSRFRVFPWAARAVRSLNDAGFRVVLFTNQSGIARGHFPESLVGEVHEVLARELAHEGARLDGVYYCPHHPDGKVDRYRQVCECRKPRPGMLLRAARELNLDLARSIGVGDKYLDIQTAQAAAARGVLVLSGYGRGELAYESHLWPRPPDHVAENLLDAVEWITGQAL